MGLVDLEEVVEITADFLGRIHRGGETEPFGVWKFERKNRALDRAAHLQLRIEPPGLVLDRLLQRRDRRVDALRQRLEFGCGADLNFLFEIPLCDLFERGVDGVDPFDDDPLQEDGDQEEDHSEEDQIRDDQNTQDGVAGNVHLPLRQAARQNIFSAGDRETEAGNSVDPFPKDRFPLLFGFRVRGDAKDPPVADAEDRGDILNIRKFARLFNPFGTVSDLDNAGLVDPGNARILKENLENAVEPGWLNQFKFRVLQRPDKFARLF